jgi:hypothetical protein
MDPCCPTCTKVCLRPQYFIKKYRYKENTTQTHGEHDEQIQLSADELCASAQSGCQLCILVWDNLLTKYNHLESPNWDIKKDSIIECCLSWKVAEAKTNDDEGEEETVERGRGQDHTAEGDMVEDRDGMPVCVRITYFLGPLSDSLNIFVNIHVWAESGKPMKGMERTY